MIFDTVKQTLFISKWLIRSRNLVDMMKAKLSCCARKERAEWKLVDSAHLGYPVRISRAEEGGSNFRVE